MSAVCYERFHCALLFQLTLKSLVHVPVGEKENQSTHWHTPISPLNKAPLHNQGVVTYMLTFDAFATRIKIFDQINVCLIAWFLTGQRSNWNHASLVLQFSQFSGYLDPLIGSQKGLWSLILVANTSTRDDDNWRHPQNVGEPLLLIHLRENLYIHVHVYICGQPLLKQQEHAASLG